MKLYQVLTLATQRFISEHYFYRVSALTYTTLLAIIPFFVITLFFTTWSPLFTYLISLADHYITQNFIPTSAISIESYFQGFVTKATHLPIGSIIFLLITSMMLINTIQDALNSIWLIETSAMRPAAWLFAWLVLMLAPLIIGVSVFLTSYLFSLPWFTAVTDQLGLTYLGVYFLSMMVNTLIFALIYIIFPNAYVSFRHGLIGAFIAAFLFELAKIAFSYYLTIFPTYELIYGAFSIIPIFLIWLYICWAIILFGGLIVYGYSQIK